MTSHPDVEALAFFAEELLEPDEERTVAHHIETCALCAATLDELTAVNGVLADVPPVPPMPQDVADLLDRRIDEAVRERAGSDDTTTEADGPVAPVVPFTRPKKRGFNGMNLPRLMMLAAAGAVVVGGGGAVLNAVMSTQQESAVGGSAAPLLQEEQGEEAVPDAAQPYKPEIVGSGTDYTSKDLADQAADVLDATVPESGYGAEGKAQDGSILIEECAVTLGERLGVRFSLVDDARFEGAPAWVLFAPTGDTTEVYVVDPAGCESPDGVLEQETLTTR
ncbi:anti-sigma factor family protein [Nocardiopsis lambiniae]|uniref:Zf-HC2 domain-containing protein n=1 Tax=Nocardiopsis lambiniae TaxID=3075539 RepID=A0ABU2MB11_9ACTN|nr:hypothetical protein [Nocardiopsis sp. DSM 44743]MDT0329727.1 hypothetical protein [Nocardiopsis sp. DSM 44743]